MITVISYPNNTVNDTITVNSSLDSNELVKYLTIDVSLAINEEYIEITYNGVTTTLLITEECRYTPYDVHFVNKNGAQQTLTFFKKRTDNLTVNSEQYEGNNGQPADH